MYHICKTYSAHSMLQYTHEEGREFSYEKTQSETYAVPVVHYDRHFHTRGYPADNRRRRTLPAPETANATTKTRNAAV